MIEELIALQVEINKQIPLAANHFEEFESAPVTEPEQDINIQFHMHEALNLLMSTHYLAAEELKKAYKQFLVDYQINANELLTDKYRKDMASFLLTKINSIYNKLEQDWRLQRKFNFISYEMIKAKAIEVVQKLVPLLCQQGLSALVIDEDHLIDQYINELHTQIQSLINQLQQQQPLTDDKLNLVNLYRREGTPHEELVNTLYVDLCYLKHYPTAQKQLNQEAISSLKNDLIYNIQQLAKKLKNRKHSYKQRYDAFKKLLDIRDTQKSSLFIAEADSFLSTLSIKDGHGEAEIPSEKSIYITRHDLG